MYEKYRQGLSTQLAVQKRLIDLGYEVLLPADTMAPYDLAFVSMTENGWFRCTKPILYRVQCKAARYIESDNRGRPAGGYLEFRGYRSYNGSGKRKGYWGEAEYFGVYSPDLDKVYLVPVQAFPNGAEIRLRVKATKNDQEKGVTWAKDYEL